MNTQALDALDADELFMLGLQSSTAGDSGSALGYLKLALTKAPGHAKAHWAIAAEYAALKMPDRAAPHFAASVELDASQPIAKFQYGLLMLTSGDLAQAETIWASLDALPAGHPVRLFKNGMLHMARDEFDAALADLRAALADPTLDPALARDVRMTIEQIEAARRTGLGASQGDALSSGAAPATQHEAPVESHLALSAYRTGGSGSTNH